MKTQFLVILITKDYVFERMPLISGNKNVTLTLLLTLKRENNQFTFYDAHKLKAFSQVIKFLELIKSH